MLQRAYAVDVEKLEETPESWQIQLVEIDGYDVASIRYIIKRCGKERSIYKVSRWELFENTNSKPRCWILHFSKRRYCPSHVIAEVDECLSASLSREKTDFLDQMLSGGVSRSVVLTELLAAGPLSFEEAKSSLARYYGVDTHQISIVING